MKAWKIATVLLLSCFILAVAASSGEAVTKKWTLKNLVNRVRGYVVPVWQIFQPGTIKGVKWQEHVQNPRFAIYDPGAPGTSDDLVLDRETGLVWEREPSGGQRDWDSYVDWCYTLNRGGRKGFRQPTMEELGSLMDLNNSNPTLPTGHPFWNIVNSYYWSANSVSSNPANSWTMHFGDGDPGIWAKSNSNINGWCVRGGQGLDGR